MNMDLPLSKVEAFSQGVVCRVPRMISDMAAWILCYWSLTEVKVLVHLVSVLEVPQH